jgi:uncharacterized repeat protein (TIGR01451 family)
MLYCDTTETVYAGTSGGLFRMASTGNSWSASNAGLPSGYVLSMGRQGTLLFAGTQNGVYSSSNSGANWSQTGLAGQKIYDLDFDPINAQRIWAASRTQGIYQTLNAGANWTNVGGALDGYTVAHDIFPYLYAGTASNGAYRYDGQQWIRQTLDATTVYHLRLAGDDGGHLLAATDRGIFLRPLPEVSLSLRSAAPNGPTVGAEITYLIDYQTTGNGIISSVSITNAIPAGTQLVAGSIQP